MVGRGLSEGINYEVFLLKQRQCLHTSKRHSDRFCQCFQSECCRSHDNQTPITEKKYNKFVSTERGIVSQQELSIENDAAPTCTLNKY